MTRIPSTIVEVTAPAWEPITLTEAKDFLRYTQADQDAQISEDIVTARQRAEDVTWRSLIKRDWDLFLDRFPPVIRLPKPPLVSVASIKYLDTGGVLTTLATIEYKVGKGTPARIRPAFGNSWPSIRHETEAVEIRFTAGYASPQKVKPEIRSWMLRHIADLFEIRQNTIIGAPVAAISKDVDEPLFAHRVFYTS